MARKKAATLTIEALATLKQGKKLYCSETTGLFAKAAANNVIAFHVKFTRAGVEARDFVGHYHAVDFTIEMAQDKARGLHKAFMATGVLPSQKKTDTVGGQTFDEVMADYVAHIRATLKTPEQCEGHLNRASKILGSRTFKALTGQDIDAFLSTITSKSSCNRIRSTLCAMFDWAFKSYRIDASPMHSLRTDWKDEESDDDTQRVLDRHEIDPVWCVLRCPESPGTIHTRRVMMLILTTALRPSECRLARREHVRDINGSNPVLYVPAAHTKKGREIFQPLNPLAVQVIKDAMASHNHDHLFPGKDGAISLDTLSELVRGGKPNRDGSARKGLLDVLGWNNETQAWTPHALRRTASTLVLKRGFTEEDIAILIDHQKKHRKGDIWRYAKDPEGRARRLRELVTVLGEELQAILYPPLRAAA